MSEALKLAQDQWSESWISDEDLCDAVALVGPERQRVPFLRAPLAALSKPLRAALFGEFREGQRRELILEDMTIDTFHALIRTAYHLEPKLTPLTALHVLKTAKLYMIEALETYCWHYLQHLEDTTSILQTLTESLKSSIVLPEELQCRYWSHILMKSSSVLQSPFFLETHGSIIEKLIKLDEFDVSEELLWDGLVQWSRNAVQKPELLGPFAVATPCQPLKRSKTDVDNPNGFGPSEAAQHEAILQVMSPYIRFTQMTKDFFVDKVRPHLDRKQSDAVIDYFLLSREPQGSLTKKRARLTDLDAFEKTQTWDLESEVEVKFVEKRFCSRKPVRITQVELVFARAIYKVAAKRIKLRAGGGAFLPDQKPLSFAEQIEKISKCTIPVVLTDSISGLIVELPISAGSVLVNLPSSILTGINVTGTCETQSEFASSVIQRLATDLAVSDSDQ